MQLQSQKFHISSDLCRPVSGTQIELHQPHAPCKGLNMPILTPGRRQGLFIRVTKNSENDKNLQLI